MRALKGAALAGFVFAVLGGASEQGMASSSCQSPSGPLEHLSQLTLAARKVLLEPVIERLKARGFVCLDPALDPNSARRCVGKIPGYPKKVAVYIPVQYDPEKSDPTLVTHLHGDVVDSSFEATLARYRLGTELHRSGTDKLLVVPESSNICDTYRQHLSTGAQFNAFQNHLKDLFQEVGLFQKDPGPGTLTHEITGHSRAYLPIGNILKSACAPGVPASLSSSCVRVRQVALFDSIFCGSRNLQDPGAEAAPGTFNENASCLGLRKFAQEHPGGIRSYYLEGSRTEVGTKLILPKMDQQREAAGGVCTGRFPQRPPVSHLTVMSGNLGNALADDFSKSCPI